MKALSIFFVTLLLLGGVALVSPADAQAPPAPCKSGKFVPKPEMKGDDPATASINLAKSKTFLAQNAKLPGVKTLPSGAQYKVITSGEKDAACANPELRVRVHYEGRLQDGTVFDTSMDGAPKVFSLNGLIPGWQQVVPMMRIGDEWEIYLPPSLGYGVPGGAGGKVPPNSALIFKMKLLGLLG